MIKKDYIFAKLITLCEAAIIAYSSMGLAAFAAYKMVPYETPQGDTSFKTWMSYTAFGNETPQQQLQEEAVTDEHGCRKIGDYYMVAMGSYYAADLGDRFMIELDNGDGNRPRRILVIIGDFKDDRHTDDKNQYRAIDDCRKNIIEFIVDTNKLDKKAKMLGDVSAIDGFEGNVAAIYKIEKIEYEKE